ncbi:alpha/beta hydrolase family protein [Lujinxingia litoralis]|nr:alpha/beta fold hydrolase [Lujinxingia litoralis]
MFLHHDDTPLRILLLGVLTCGALACGEDQSADQPDAGHLSDTPAPDPYDTLPEQPWLLTEHGHYSVGYAFESLIYTPRGPQEAPREITISIWHPTFDTEGRAARYLNVLNAPDVLQDASVAIRDSDPAPLMIFSHGNGSFSIQSYFFAEYLASHGFVVIAPDHKGNTFSDTGGAVRLESTVYRPQDMSAVLDWVEQLPADHPLHGKTSRDKIAISGHSLGGFTTLATTGASIDLAAVTAGCTAGTISQRICEIFEADNAAIFGEGFLDARFQASLPMTPAGSEVFLPGIANITIPTLVWTAGQDLTLPNPDEGDPLWEGMAGQDHVRIDIANAGHFTFSNLCELLAPAVPEFQNDGCGEDNMAYEEAFEIINAYSLAFLRKHLDGASEYDAMLAGDSPMSDALLFERKPD